MKETSVKGLISDLRYLTVVDATTGLILPQIHQSHFNLDSFFILIVFQKHYKVVVMQNIP